MPKITCFPDNKVIEVRPSKTLLENLLNEDIPHTHACGGEGNFSTCRVMILEGIENCSNATHLETALAERLDFPFHVRLACQTKITGNVTVRRLVVDQDDIDIIENQLISGNVNNNDRSVALLSASIQSAMNFDEVNFHYDIVYVMNRYFHKIQKVIDQYQGVTTNVMGTKVLAVFGIQGDSLNPVENAVWAGIDLLEAVKELNIFLEKMSYQPINLSVAIHYGPTVFVPVGDNKKSFLTALGDNANFIHNLEKTGQEQGIQLLVSNTVYPFVMDKAVMGRKVNSSLDNSESYEITEMVGERPQFTKAESGTTQQKIFSFVQKFSSFWKKSDQ